MTTKPVPYPLDNSPGHLRLEYNSLHMYHVLYHACIMHVSDIPFSVLPKLEPTPHDYQTRTLPPRQLARPFENGVQFIAYGCIRAYPHAGIRVVSGEAPPMIRGRSRLFVSCTYHAVSGLSYQRRCIITYHHVSSRIKVGPKRGMIHA